MSYFNKPDISILFATYNRMGLLEKTLSHLERQEVDHIRWELIVIDNGSNDDTVSVLANFQEKLPLIVLQEPQPGKNRALNRGLEVASGDLFVFTDDDVEHEPSWLAELFAASKRWSDCSIFGGSIFPIYPPEMPAWLQEDHYAMPFYAKFMPRLPEGILPLNRFPLPFGPNFAVRAKALNGLRFSTNLGPQGKSYPLGDETEFLKRLVAKGETVVYVPQATVRHFVGKHQVEAAWLFQRAFNLGRGMAQLNGIRELKSLTIYCKFIERTLSGMNKVDLMDYDRTSLEHGIKYNYLQGILFEYKKLEAESEMSFGKKF
jgi:hypothetical protein